MSTPQPPQSGKEPDGQGGGSHRDRGEELTGTIWRGRRPPGEDLLGEQAGELARNLWPALLAAGIASVAIGVILLAWPNASLTVASVVVGAGVLVAGLVRLIQGFSEHGLTSGRRVVYVVIGLLAAVVGLFLLRHKDLTLFLVTFLIGVFWVMHGITDLGIAMSGRFSGRGLTMAAGVLSIVAGFAVLFWPGISIFILVVILGVWLVVYGLIMTAMAMTLRRRAGSLT